MDMLKLVVVGRSCHVVNSVEITKVPEKNSFFWGTSSNTWRIYFGPFSASETDVFWYVLIALPNTPVFPPSRSHFIELRLGTLGWDWGWLIEEPRYHPDEKKTGRGQKEKVILRPALNKKKAVNKKESCKKTKGRNNKGIPSSKKVSVFSYGV